MLCGFAGEAQVAVLVLAPHGDRLDLTEDGPMQLYLDVAYSLHEQVSARQQLVSITMRWKCDAVVATS